MSLFVWINIPIFKYKVKEIEIMKKSKNKFQIIPIEHPTLNVVYVLTEGNETHGKFGSRTAAEKRMLEIIGQRDTLKAIQDTENVEFEVEL